MDTELDKIAKIVKDITNALDLGCLSPSLIVRLRVDPGSSIDRRFTAYFDGNVTLPMCDGSYAPLFGFGATPEQAMKDCLKKTNGKTIAYNDITRGMITAKICFAEDYLS